MTTPQLLQQAKQGDPDAIAQLMNQSLEPKGIKATVSRGGDRLRVLLKSENELNQPLLTQFIHKGIQNLNIPSVNAVEVVGQSQAAADWSQTLVLQAPPTSITPPAATITPPATTPEPPTLPANMTSDVTSPSGVDVSPPPIAPSIAQNDLDLSVAALDDDFSLDDELSLAEIDQIVADAVKEVTTKIQSEIPFDSTTDEESTASLYGPPGTYTSTPLSETELPMDEAIRQAVQADDLDKFIDQELALPDAVTTIEQDGVPLEDDDFQLSDSDTLSDPPITESQDEGESSPANSVDLEEESTPIATRVDSDSEEGTIQTSTADERSASKVLLTIVSLLTFGAIAGVIGYSVQDYIRKGGNVWAFPPTLSPGSGDTVNDATDTDDGTSETATSTTDATTDDDNDSAATGESDSGDETVASESPNGDSEAQASTDTDTADPADTTDTEAPEPETTTENDTANVETLAATASPALEAAIASTSCPTVLGGSELTVTQIEVNSAAGTTYPIVGCLTNHTDKPIISAVIKYQGQPTEAAADIVPQDEWSLSSTNEGIGKLTFAELPPKATAVFIAELPVAEGTTSIDLKSLAWRPEGWDGDAKQMDLGFSMELN